MQADLALQLRNRHLAGHAAAPQQRTPSPAWTDAVITASPAGFDGNLTNGIWQATLLLLSRALLALHERSLLVRLPSGLRHGPESC